MHLFQLLIQFQGISFLFVNCLSLLFVHFRSFSYMAHSNDRYSLSPRVGIVDVAATSFLSLLLFGVFSVNSIELMYPKQIELM
jgi:hypothetical protein